MWGKNGLKTATIGTMLKIPNLKNIKDSYENIFEKYTSNVVKLSMFRNMVGGWVKRKKDHY